MEILSSSASIRSIRWLEFFSSFRVLSRISRANLFHLLSGEFRRHRPLNRDAKLLASRRLINSSE